MQVSLDTIIFTVFIILNLAVGLFYSRGIKDATEYAIGKRDFSTRTVATTVIATYIGASFFTTALVESYRQGLYFIIPVLGEPLCLVISGYFLIPRMVEFIGSTSVAEIMGKFYGKPVRVITAISGMLFASGIVALQFKVAASVIQLFGISEFYALVLSAVVVILYSAFGGIKAVTFTDALQFLTFSAVLPLIAFVIWQTTDVAQVIHTLSHNPLFDYTEVLNIHNPRFSSMAFLFLYFVLPIGMSSDPAYIQRISMSKGTNQASKSFIIAGFVSLGLLLIICSMSILLLSNNPDLDPNNLLTYVIDNYTYTGLKGLTAICIMAVIMSTADSYINAASVLLTHDIIKVLKPTPIPSKMDLPLLRFVAFVIGVIAFIFSYKISSLFAMLMTTLNFYMPIVSPPLLLAVFGFRSSTKVALAGIIAGGVTALLWSDNGAMPGMLANLIVFIIAHLISGRPKNPASPEYKDALKLLKQQRHHNLSNLLKGVKNFNLMGFCHSIAPTRGVTYILVGSFAIFAVSVSTYMLPYETRLENDGLLNILYCSILAISSVLCIYPIYPPFFKQKKCMVVFWVTTIPYILIFTPTLFLIISNFGQFQIITFLISIIILVLLSGYQTAFAMFAITSLLGINFYKLHARPLVSVDTEIALQFKIMYALFLIGATIIAFLKPKQEEQERTKEMVEHLKYNAIDLEAALSKATNLKDEFLRNLQHETNTPLTGICSMSQAVSEMYDKLTDEERKRVIDTIAMSSNRLISYVHNLVDVSKLITHKFKRDVRTVNLSRLTEEAVRRCKRLYISNEAEDDREIILNIEPKITVQCDEYLIKRSFENIIINAIQYCKKGAITITLAKIQSTDPNQSQAEGQNRRGKIIFSVKDEGIGIPPQDLSSIFEPFTTSSKTRTPAGGRGVGLTLVREVVQMHKGTVTAESNNEKPGSLFTVTLPVL